MAQVQLVNRRDDGAGVAAAQADVKARWRPVSLGGVDRHQPGAGCPCRAAADGRALAHVPDEPGRVVAAIVLGARRGVD